MAGNILSVGILCNGTTFQRWQADAIRHVLSEPGVKIVALIVDGRTAEERTFGQRINGLGTYLYRQYRKRNSPPAMDTVDLQAELGSVPNVQCKVEVEGPAEQFTQKDLDAISAYQPDVILRFGFNILTGEILTLPRFGVWSFHHGDPTQFRGGPPGLWEIVKRSHTTGAILQRLTEKLDAGYILRQGWFQTIDHSHKETVETVLSNSAIWPAQVLRELVASRSDATVGKVPSEKGKLYRYPGNTEFLNFLWIQFNNKIRFHRNDLQQHEEWNIGILHQPIQSLLEQHGNLNVRWLPAPAAGSFRADPFGYAGPDGSLNVLYEKFDHGEGKGEISRMRPKPDNVLKRSRTMLKTDGHLSYPYVVERNGEVYVIPESASAEHVAMYRINEENTMELVRVLLEAPLFDPTLFEHDGRWWLFGTKAPLTNVALYAFWSENLEGPYTPHTGNPIKFDIRSARPAGTPFRHDNALWRPAQDSSKTYGGRIAMNRILCLTPTEFEEETVSHVEPFPNTQYDQGVHTLCAFGDITLIDGKRFTTVPQRKKQVRKQKLQRSYRKLTK